MAARADLVGGVGRAQLNAGPLVAATLLALEPPAVSRASCVPMQ